MTFDPSTSPLPGPKVLLMGDGGTGKTRSLGTLVDCGLEVFVLSVEQGIESLFRYWTDAKKPIPRNLHYMKVEQPKTTFLTLAESAFKVNTMSLETLGKMVDPNRQQHNTFIKINEAFYKFTDQYGKEFPPADQWGPNMVIALDGLTGLSRAAMSLQVGGRPLRNPGDYGMAQGQIENFLRLICDHLRCWFVLISHVEKEVDPILGGYKISPATVGKALPPLLPPMFSEVVYCTREGTRWAWNTSTTGAATKARYLPWAEGMVPDFRPLYESWKTQSQAALEQMKLNEADKPLAS